jgi:hypothetical protein
MAEGQMGVGEGQQSHGVTRSRVASRAGLSGKTRIIPGC